MLYIFQNDPEVPPGLLVEELDRIGVPWQLFHLWRGEALPQLPKKKALVVLGGSMGANDDQRYPFLSGLKLLIREAVEEGIPYLGICLGGQLLAAALGAEVTSGVHAEKGTYSVTLTDAGSADRLFRGIAPQFPSFQWHNDSFAIPREGVRLAYSEACPNQAFRVGSCAWGIQFHPEVDPGIIRNWSSWTGETAALTEAYVAAYQDRAATYREVAHRLVENLLGTF